MESQQLQSKMWSCSSLDNALEALKSSENLPDDPQKLQAFIEDPMVCWDIFKIVVIKHLCFKGLGD